MEHKGLDWLVKWNYKIIFNIKYIVIKTLCGEVTKKSKCHCDEEHFKDIRDDLIWLVMLFTKTHCLHSIWVYMYSYKWSWRL